MIYKRGSKRSSKYWTKFQHQGRMIYKSTGQTSATKARQCEAKLRSELAMVNFGILERKSVPTLAEFIRERVEPKMQQPDGKRRKQRFHWLRSAMRPSPPTRSVRFNWIRSPVSM